MYQLMPILIMPMWLVFALFGFPISGAFASIAIVLIGIVVSFRAETGGWPW